MKETDWFPLLNAEIKREDLCMKRLVAFFFVLVMTVMVFSGSIAEANADKIIVTFLTTGVTPQDLNKVQDAVNEITIPEINVEVEFKPLSIGATFSGIYSTWIASGEVMDLMMIAFQDLSSYVKTGAIEPLDKLLDQYAPSVVSLKAQIPMTSGATFGGEVYGVAPITPTYGLHNGIIFRKDIFDETGVVLKDFFTEVYTYEEMTELMAKTKELHPDSYPFGILGSDISSSLSYSTFFMEYDTLGVTIRSGVLTSPDSTEVVNLFELEEYKEYLKLMREWHEAGYIMPDAATTDTMGSVILSSGRSYSYAMNLQPEQASVTTLGSFGWESVRLPLTKGYMNSAPGANTYWAIPITSKHPDGAARFLELLYSRPEINNLIMNGIEGLHYVMTETEGIIDFPEGIDSSNSPFYNQLGFWGDRRLEYIWNGGVSPEDNDAFTSDNMKRSYMSIGYSYDASKMTNKIIAIVDIDMNWRNPITNVRTFGSNPKVVEKMGLAYLKGVASAGNMIPCVKHFPGDGVDERDQHLVATVNSLTADEWWDTYGVIYRTMIENGAMSIMAGHILQPELCREINPDIKDKDILPASVSKELLNGVLRNKLGFNGLIVTDATPMVGFTTMLKRSDALCMALEAGVDMILFWKDAQEDFDAIVHGLEAGKVTAKRLDEAVIRVLATKAAMGLHLKQHSAPSEADMLKQISGHKHALLAQACADQAITLVKDNQKLLPISPKTHRHIRLTILGEGENGGFGDNAAIESKLKEKLEAAGFEVSLYDYQSLERGEIFTAGIGQMKQKFDLNLVAANIANGSNNTTRRVDWITLMAANAPWYHKDIPTIFVSFANPYHLADVPYISTFINCYSNNEYCVNAFVEKLLGKSAFKGKSPVDVFCNIWGADFM